MLLCSRDCSVAFSLSSLPSGHDATLSVTFLQGQNVTKVLESILHRERLPLCLLDRMLDQYRESTQLAIQDDALSYIEGLELSNPSKKNPITFCPVHVQPFALKQVRLHHHS